jgi:hypothetical protein
MSIENQIANLILTPCLGGALYLVWVHLAVPCMRESMRNRVFQLRREMFLLVAHGELFSDHQAYGLLRSKMNLLVRCANSVSIRRTMVARLAINERCKAATHKLDGAIQVLPDITRAKVESIRKRLDATVACFMFQRSFLFWVLSALLLPFVAILIGAIRVGQLANGTYGGSARKIFERLLLRSDWGVQGIECIEEEELADARGLTAA